MNIFAEKTSEETMAAGKKGKNPEEG